jgi:hypothetical protein
VIALASAHPFYRDLREGDVGEDVAGLNAELARLGYEAPESSEFTSQTRDAWIGLQQAVGATSVSKVALLGDILWLPGATVEVARWLVSLGAPVPGDGVVGVVPGETVSARLALSDASDPPTGSLVLRAAGQTTNVDGVGLVTDAVFLAAATRQARMQLAFQPDGNGDWQLPGTVSLAVPVHVSGVPPAAVFGVIGQEGCIEVQGRGVPIRIVGSSLGVSLVRARDGADLTSVAIGDAITLTDC